MGDKDNASATFVLYCDWEDIIEDLTDEEVGKLFKAIFAYVNHDSIEKFDGRSGLGVAFKTIRKQIDVNRKKYEQVVEKRKKAAFKRWEKQNTSTQMHDLHMQSDAKNANANFAMHNVNENGNGNGNGNESVNVNGNERNDNVASAEPDFSAVELSESQLFSLFSFSSQKQVEEYVEKARQWQLKNKRKYKDPYETLRKWIEQDKAKGRLKDDTPPSYDLNEYEKFARSYDFSDMPWNVKEG